MRTTVVPAQITSVEDKIAGSLSFSQLLLLTVPLFLSVAIYILLPPFVNFHIYKVVIAGVFTAVCLLLAIRFKGRLISEWIGLRARYNARPIHHVFDKNTLNARKPIRVADIKLEKAKKEVEELPKLKLIAFKPKEQLQFETATSNPKADFHFVVDKKGALNVRIKKIS